MKVKTTLDENLLLLSHRVKGKGLILPPLQVNYAQRSLPARLNEIRKAKGAKTLLKW